MTVSNNIPIEEHIGNGVVKSFAWDWQMINDSAIEVLVDNEHVDGWSIQGKSVVFDSAPDPGAKIIIYRRTKLWMPEDYLAFGRFHSEKTELSVDRAIMIAQEYAGDRSRGQAPNGIVGGADLRTRHNAFNVDVISERGTDARIPMWIASEDDPGGDPDPAIVWAGADVKVGIYSLEGNTNGVSATIVFYMDVAQGSPDVASAVYTNFNAFEDVDWLNQAAPDDAYWMRVLPIGTPDYRLTINTGTRSAAYGEPFQMRRHPEYATITPSIYINTFGDTPPITRTGEVRVDICKDDNGLPDGNWASRNVYLEARFGTDIPDELPIIDIPDVPEDGTQWDEFFLKPFALDSHYDMTRSIPDEGVFLKFVVPDVAVPYLVLFYTVGVTSITTTRTGAVNVTAGDFITPPTEVWGLGNVISGSIGGAVGTDIELIPGNTYFFNVKNTDPSGTNQIRLLIDIFMER